MTAKKKPSPRKAKPIEKPEDNKELITEDTERTVEVSPYRNPKMGAPSTYDPIIAAEICRRIADDESLVSICADPQLPPRRTVHQWLLNPEGKPEYEDFMRKYVRARDLQPETTYERLIEVEQMILSEKINSNAARVLLDSMHWRMSKRLPKRYGDHRQLEVSGGIDLTVSPIKKALPAAAQPIPIKAQKPRKKKTAKSRK